MKMPKFKAVLWEQVSVWQTVTVIAEADSEDALRNGNYQIEDYLNQDTEWSTEQHLCFDALDIEVLEEITE
jgi:hypothetical protein